MRSRLLAALVVAACLWGAARDPARAPLALRSPVQDKNFYLLSMFERTAAVRQALEAEPGLRRLAESKRQALNTAVESCGQEVSCYTNALLWKEAEVDSAGKTLRELYGSNQGLRRLVDGEIRRSGMFQRYHAKSGEELLAQAWGDAARAMDNIIEIYGAGRAPRYTQIDANSYDVKSPSYRLLVRTVVAVLQDDSAALKLFFQPSLRFAMSLLDANHRDEAGRLEPLETGENAAAIRRIRSIRWDRFPYSVIVVPGSGPDRLTFNLSAMGKLRLALAAKRWREGKAPLILVSGGFVHPAQTPFAEAMEMKKSLIADFGIPADAILVDPHARHTTTNLRNAARQIYRYGIPFEKTALITTDRDQSRAIESAAFGERCLRELGYKPYALRARISPFDLEFLPMLDSLQADAMDPLDP